LSYNEYRILRTNACNKTGRPQTRVDLPVPDSFELWVLKAIRHFESIGAKIELCKSGNIQVFWPKTKNIVIRTIEDLKDEYITEYLPKFPILTTLPFENNAGVC
jgi:hypothetical protein